MRDPVLAALRSKLVTYESAGLDDLAKRVKARIAKLEKAAKAAEPEEAPLPKKLEVGPLPKTVFVSKSEEKRITIQQAAAVTPSKSKES